ncbi:MAG TPA: response regulator transcription factor, partial [Acidimicrobiales bacterium]|nr:response regulator transcription factor [Acidimicrobiales bacterium]
DDYLTKPFSMRELVARVQALLRRLDALSGRTQPKALHLDDGIEIDLDARRVRQHGEVVHLTPTEFDLLVGLAERPGRVLTRERLLIDVWGYRDGSGARTVDSHVRALRRKLGDGVVRTVHGVGYALGESAEPAGDSDDAGAGAPAAGSSTASDGAEAAGTP